MKTITRVSVSAAAIGALAAAGATPALTDVERRGTCTASSNWEADAEGEGGFFEVDFEVNTPTEGEDWQVVIRQNGQRILADTRPATKDFDDRHADVDWSVVAGNKSGARDRFAFTAQKQVTGETCRATLRI